MADAESSSIRKIDVSSGNVTTLIGKGLFSWGDSTGPLETAKLQHDQGLALHGDTLYIADTYNSKIKALNLGAGLVTEVAGGGTPPWFFNPGGLTVSISNTEELLVADTQHDNIVSVDVTGAKPPKRWDVVGLTPP